jgi:uncharacterized protein DUF6973
VKNSLKLGILLVGVSLFLWNCSKENINIPLSLQQQDSVIMTIQQKFSLVNYQDSFIKNNLIVNWNNFVNSNSINAKTIKGNLDNIDNDLPSNNSITYEFSTNIQSKINSTRDTTAFYSKITLSASIDKMRNNISYKIIRYSSAENKNLKLINLNSLDGFTGSISFFDLNGNILQMEAYKKGNLIQSIKEPSTNSKNISYKVPDISGGDTGIWVMMTVFHYIDWYTNSLGGTTLYYSHSTLDNITHEWVFINTGSSYSSGNTYHDHFDNPHGPAPSTHNDNHPNEIILEDNAVIQNFEQDYRTKMSDDELSLFDNLSRVEQIKYLWSAKEAWDKTDELYFTPCEKYNGKGDAFRHAYWNALSTQRLGVALTNQLTTRHENRPSLYPYNRKENEMDLFNNQIGRNIGSQSLNSIIQDIQTALNNGELRYISNQASNCRATYSSQLIPTNQ